MNARLPADALRQLDTLRHDGIALLEGEIGHRRTRPAANAFAYRGFCLRLPLSRLAELPSRGVALNTRGAIAFHDRDHGARDGTPCEAWIRAILAREGVDAGGEIVLYTFPRMLGYLFAPVSFWVAHDRDDAVRAVLAEVRNTFGERHDYLVAHDDGRPIASGETIRASKVFHVSPFCEVEGHYRFRFTGRGAHHTARIDYHDRDGPLLVTAISGDEREITPGLLARTFFAYPFMTLFVIGRIHWHALRLWAKRVPWYRKPEPPLQETTR